MTLTTAISPLCTLATSRPVVGPHGSAITMTIMNLSRPRTRMPTLTTQTRSTSAPASALPLATSVAAHTSLRAVPQPFPPTTTTSTRVVPSTTTPAPPRRPRRSAFAASCAPRARLAARRPGSSRRSTRALPCWKRSRRPSLSTPRRALRLQSGRELSHVSFLPMPQLLTHLAAAPPVANSSAASGRHSPSACASPSSAPSASCDAKSIAVLDLRCQPPRQPAPGPDFVWPDRSLFGSWLSWPNMPTNPPHRVCARGSRVRAHICAPWPATRFAHALTPARAAIK